jgi:hypothetical protein
MTNENSQQNSKTSYECIKDENCPFGGNLVPEQIIPYSAHSPDILVINSSQIK